MSINRFLTKGFSVILLILLCTALFSCTLVLDPKSLFAPLNKPNTETISHLRGDELLSAMAVNRGSKVFYETLTLDQTIRILRTLNAVILKNSGGVITGSVSSQEVFTQLPSLSIDSPQAKRITQAALAQIDIFINTSSLCYAVINNMADAILKIQEYQNNIGGNVLYGMFAAPIVASISQKEFNIVATFFTNMYLISDRYLLITKYAQNAMVDGGDLQICTTAAIFSSIVGIAANILDSGLEGLDKAVDLIVETAREMEESGQDIANLELFLEELGEKIASDYPENPPFTDIPHIFSEQISLRLKSIEGVAIQAGYIYLGQGLSIIVKKIGGV